MSQLRVSNVDLAGPLKATMGQLQLKLNEDKEALYTRRADIGVLTCKTSAPQNSIVFTVQMLRRMKVDSATGELSHEAKVVFHDVEGNDRGAIDVKDFPCFLLLSLNDDRKAFNVFTARADSDLSSALDASFTYAISPTTDQANPQDNKTIDEVSLTLGLGNTGGGGPMISIRDLSLWRSALWRREGLLTVGDKVDKDYNVKTLAHLSFSGSLNPLVEQYKKSLKI